MTDEATFWERVETVLARVAAAPEAERARRLEELSDGDERLRTEVASLLRSRDDIGDFLESSVLDAVDRADPEVGRTVGSYRLEERVGTGGMGAVYRARRVDGGFEQEVAVKLIRDALADPDLRRRFSHERQILASLRHPNIARLLDGGVTESGRPFLAMEFVRGRPITAHCDALRLDVDRRLDLFDTVCAAVQHAHANLVVHRDLKPAHIVIDEDGEPRLLDFGIAAVVADDGTRAEVTATQQRRFTPQYASPEQVRGEPVTTATDVYALGVILYELLTGRRPYRVEGESAEAQERAICETTPAAPSRVLDTPGDGEAPEPSAVAEARGTDVARLRRRLRGDLDTIVLTALRKEPQRRYASIEALREDLRRFRRGLPIAARPDTFAYRSAKFLRRHRLPVTAGAALAIALVAGVVGIAWQARAANIGRQRAVAALRTSEMVEGFLRSILSAADPREGGQEMTVREALDRAAARIDEEFAGEPEVEARVREAIGMTYRTLGVLDAAEPHLVRAYALAIEVFGAGDAETARIAHELALHRMDGGQFPEAERLFVAAMDARREALGPANPDTLESRLMLAGVCMQQGRLEEARGHMEAVVAAREAVDPGAAETLVAKNDLAGVLQRLGRLDEALALGREVYDAQVTTLGPEHPDTLISANDIGGVLRQLDRYDEAVDWYRRAVAGLSKQYPAGSLDVVIPRRNLAVSIGRLGRHREALERERAVLVDAEAGLGPEHYVAGVVRLDIAGWLAELGETERSREEARRARAILVPVFGDDHPYVRRADELSGPSDP